MCSESQRKNLKMVYRFINKIINKYLFSLLFLFLLTSTMDCYAMEKTDFHNATESAVAGIKAPTFTFTTYEAPGCMDPGEQPVSLHIKNGDIGDDFGQVFTEQCRDISCRRIRSLTIDNCRFHPASPDEASPFLFLRRLPLSYLTIRNSNLADAQTYEVLKHLSDDLNHLDLSNNQLGQHIGQFTQAVHQLIGGHFHVRVLYLFGNPINVNDASVQLLLREIRKKINIFKIEEGEPLTEFELSTLTNLLKKLGASPAKQKETKRIAGLLGQSGLVPFSFAGAVSDLGKLNFDAA